MCFNNPVLRRVALGVLLFYLVHNVPAFSQPRTVEITYAEKINAYTQKYGYVAMKGSPLRQLAADNAAFGMDIYTQISKNPGNIFFSPYSISEAFAMLYVGAKGETASELERTLHITLKADNLHTAYRDMLKGFDEFVAYKTDMYPDTKLHIDVANGLWVQDGFPLNNTFVTTLHDYHRSVPTSLDFKGADEKSRATINDWISDRTRGMIKDIMAPGSINSATRLVLANSIYFEAKWREPFISSATKEGEFHRLDNTTVPVPMMYGHTMDIYGYADNTDWQAAQIAYLNNSMAMLIILPRPGKFSEVERMLNGEFLASLDDSLRWENLILTIPKLKFTSPALSLKETLRTIGLKAVFTEKADLSGISTNPLVLSDALHKASVAVDEEGTIAAAATVLPMIMGINRYNFIEFTADRPFIFLIRDLKSRAVLFMGRVVDPS